MQSVSSRIWTRVAVSISYDDIDYTTGTSFRLLYDWCFRLYHQIIHTWYFVVFYSFESFLPQRKPTVFPLDFEPQQFSLCLQDSSLVDLNNAVIWLVSTRPHISKSLYEFFWDCSKCTQYNRYHRQLRVLELFLVLLQGLIIYLSFYFIAVRYNSKVHYSVDSLLFLFFLFFFFFFFVVDYLLVWSSGRY